MELVEFAWPPPVPAEFSEQPKIEGHVQKNVKRDLPRLGIERGRDGVFAIVGGSPSVKDHLPRLRELQSEPNGVCCVPGPYTWLIKNGIVPKWCVLHEVNVDMKALGEEPNDETVYLVASHSHASIFDHLKGRKIVMWHAYAGVGERKIVEEVEGEKTMIVGGGTTTVLRCTNIGLLLGYRQLEMFGCDSSFDEQSHIYHKGLQADVAQTLIDIEFNGKWYKTAHYLAKQAKEFSRFMKAIHDPGLEPFMPAPRRFTMKVHGQGLLPDIHRHMYPNQEA